MLTRTDKIARLLDSPHKGEREAAREALKRVTITAPAQGSPEWCSAMIEHHRMVQECAVRISEPSLTAAEVVTIRNWSRFIGRPWEKGADELRRIHRKLTEQAQDQCLALPNQ